MGKTVEKDRSSLADDLQESLQEAIDHFAGKPTGAVTHTVHIADTEAREARLMLGMSQNEFAAMIGTGVGTVRKWELGTRRPSGAARTLIDVIKKEQKAVKRALATKPDRVA